VSRLLCFPSGEFLDNLSGLSTPTIGRRFSGEGVSGVVDEIAGATREQLFPMTLVDDPLDDSATTITVTSSEGTPNEADLPTRPGILKIGDELVVFTEAAIVGNVVEFRGCTSGVMRTVPRSYDQGTQLEMLFGILVES